MSRSHALIASFTSAPAEAPQHVSREASAPSLSDSDRRARELARIREQHGRHTMIGVAVGMTVEQAQRRSPLFRPSTHS